MGVDEKEVGMREWYWRDLERESVERDRKRRMRMGFDFSPIVRDGEGERSVFMKKGVAWGGL